MNIFRQIYDKKTSDSKLPTQSENAESLLKQSGYRTCAIIMHLHYTSFTFSLKRS